MSIPGKVTISNIAAAAGVSKATVSRYLNGHKEMMGEETGERIRQAIEEANYRPSDIARNLKRRTSNLIGVVISDISSPFSSAVVIGVSEYLERQGFSPLFTNSADDPSLEAKNIASLLAKGVSGLIVNTASYDNQTLLDVGAGGMPVVLCDRYVRNSPFDIVTSRDNQGMHDLVLHLKNEGYTRPVFFTQKWERNSVRYIRRESFIHAVEELFGYSPEEDVYLVSAREHRSAYAALTELRERLRPGDIPAVIGVNSVTTIRAYKAIRQLGLVMPHNIGLCGPEDWDWDNEMNWPTLVNPNITTLVLQSTEIGRNSAKLLLSRIKDPKKEQEKILMPCEICVRQSTLRLD
mgnify:CR=1 FL=1